MNQNQREKERHAMVTKKVLERFDKLMETKTFIELSFYGSQAKFWMSLNIISDTPNNPDTDRILTQSEFDSGKFDYIINSLFDIHYAKNKYKIKSQMRKDMAQKSPK